MGTHFNAATITLTVTLGTAIQKHLVGTLMLTLALQDTITKNGQLEPDCIYKASFKGSFH